MFDPTETFMFPKSSDTGMCDKIDEGEDDCDREDECNDETDYNSRYGRHIEALHKWDGKSHAQQSNHRQENGENVMSLCPVTK